jgi:hypothetical protein
MFASPWMADLVPLAASGHIELAIFHDVEGIAYFMLQKMIFAYFMRKDWWLLFLFGIWVKPRTLELIIEN